MQHKHKKHPHPSEGKGGGGLHAADLAESFIDSIPLNIGDGGVEENLFDASFDNFAIRGRALFHGIDEARESVDERSDGSEVFGGLKAVILEILYVAISDHDGRIVVVYLCGKRLQRLLLLAVQRNRENSEFTHGKSPSESASVAYYIHLNYTSYYSTFVSKSQ